MKSSIIVLAIATWYGDAHHGKDMANGHPFDMSDHTVATYLYPLGTELELRYKDRSVHVLVTDRCDNKTEIDLSKAAFEILEGLDVGRIEVEVVFNIADQTKEWKEKYNCPDL